MNPIARWTAISSLALSLAAGAASAEGSKEGPAAAPKLPADMASAVLLADGRQVAGVVESTKVIGQFVLKPADGGSHVPLTRYDVLAAEKDGTVTLRGDDEPVFRLWRDAAQAAWCDAAEAVARDYAKAQLVTDARRVIERMRACGAAAARLVPIEALLPGKAQVDDPKKQAKIKTAETAAAKTHLDALSRGVDWCGKRGFNTAAMGLLEEISRWRASPEGAAVTPAGGDPAERAKALVPAAFPWKGAPDAVKRWTDWARALLPSSAEFVDANDDVWKRLVAEPWKSAKPLAFRTRNVLLFCMDQDPAVCGHALRIGEGTVRAVQAFLNAGEREDVAGDADRLEVRIHKDRASYMSEENSLGLKPEAWSGGFFSPADGGISRFYVSRGGGGPNLSELTRVVSHELTHHYMQMRWMHGASGRGAGHWVVEGMAVFVENQAPRMATRGLAFDDENVPNLRHVAAIAKMNALLPFDTYIDGDYRAFQNLSDEMSPPFGSERHRWYEQSGALCFYMLHGRGAAAREDFVQYVRLHYIGNARKEGWFHFGFESAEDMQKQFSDWLAGLSKGK